MADVTITAANVLAGSNAQIEDGIAGETITAGKSVYRSSTTRLLMMADSNSATAEARTPLGIALNGASAGQPLKVQKSGDITLGGLTANVTYFQSDTPGGICPDADVGSGEYPCIVGIAKSSTVLAIAIKATGVAR